MILRFLSVASTALLLSGAATPNNCGGVGLATCFYCGNPVTAAVGTPILCPISPGGLEDPKDCVGWRIPADLCITISGGNCDNDYICCPIGWTGYFFCNEWIIDNGSGICEVEARCSRGCCSGSPGTYLFTYDCDGDGVYEASASGYTCTIFMGP